MTDIPLSKLFLLLEKECRFNTISCQVNLAETIELITGSIISENIRKYRGLFLNIERASNFFYLFYKFFQFFKDDQTSKMAFDAYSSFTAVFEILCDNSKPWGIIRPATILKPLQGGSVPTTRRKILHNQKIAWKIAKEVELGEMVKSSLKGVENLTLNDIRKTSITGPIARASGAIPSLSRPQIIRARLSALQFLQFSYTTEGNLWNILRVCYSELILALNRIDLLLQEFLIFPEDLLKKSISGTASSSFPTFLGEGHLTVNLSQSQIKYFNYVLPGISNLVGITNLVEKCPDSLKPLILLFFDPDIPDLLP
jgi:Ni,Fe-hydrogenase III large subunit